MPMSIHLKTAAALAGLMMSTGLALADAAMVQTQLNVRAGPGLEFAVIGVLPAGASVDVSRCSGSWCMVAWTGGQGFASSSRLAFAHSGAAFAATRPVIAAPPVVAAPVIASPPVIVDEPVIFATPSTTGVGVTIGGPFVDPRFVIWPDPNFPTEGGSDSR